MDKVSAPLTRSKSSLRTATMLPLLLLAMAGCTHMGADDADSSYFGRYSHYMWEGIPNPYTDLENPLPASTENIASGKKLYQTQCQLCHGVSGGGDGPAGKQLVPRPADLAFTRKLPIASDAFLFWTMSDGGKPIGTAMPAFGDRLSDKEIWQITHYINDGFDS